MRETRKPPPLGELGGMGERLGVWQALVSQGVYPSTDCFGGSPSVRIRLTEPLAHATRPAYTRT